MPIAAYGQSNAKFEAETVEISRLKAQQMAQQSLGASEVDASEADDEPETAPHGIPVQPRIDLPAPVVVVPPPGDFAETFSPPFDDSSQEQEHDVPTLVPPGTDGWTASNGAPLMDVAAEHPNLERTPLDESGRLDEDVIAKAHIPPELAGLGQAAGVSTNEPEPAGPERTVVVAVDSEEDQRPLLADTIEAGAWLKAQPEDQDEAEAIVQDAPTPGSQPPSLISRESTEGSENAAETGVVADQIGQAFDVMFDDSVQESAAQLPSTNTAAASVDKGLKTEWFVAINDEQVGPLTKVEVAEKWAVGEIHADTLCWRKGMSDWTMIRDVEDLVDLRRRPADAVAVPDLAKQQEFSGARTEAPTPTLIGPPPEPPRSELPSIGSSSSAWRPSAASALASLAAEELSAPAKPAAEPEVSAEPMAAVPGANRELAQILEGSPNEATAMQFGAAEKSKSQVLAIPPPSASMTSLHLRTPLIAESKKPSAWPLTVAITIIALLGAGLAAAYMAGRGSLPNKGKTVVAEAPVAEAVPAKPAEDKPSAESVRKPAPQVAAVAAVNAGAAGAGTQPRAIAPSDESSDVNKPKSVGSDEEGAVGKVAQSNVRPQKDEPWRFRDSDDPEEEGNRRFCETSQKAPQKPG